jgi:hypothetical protein
MTTSPTLGETWTPIEPQVAQLGTFLKTCNGQTQTEKKRNGKKS